MYTFALLKTTKMNYRKEHIIYTMMWIALYLSPLMSIYIRMSVNPHIVFSWDEIINAWVFNTVWIILFAIHNFLLVPLLIIKRRTGLYAALVVALLVATMFTLSAIRPSHRKMRHATQSYECCEYGCMDAQMIPPKQQTFSMREDAPLVMFGPGEVVAFFGGLLLMGMNLGVKLYFMSQRDRERQKIIDQRNLEQQMEYLKYQVNPHFFMNTLNNIHALVDIDPERAKTTIVELSKMMRHILYEGSKKLILLTREVEFLNLYVQLMRLRYTRKVHINVDVPPQLPELKLPPLMLIIFVENAFKHGISYREESFIDIKLRVENKRLLFSCCNSKPTQVQRTNEKGGMGLQNVRQRLELLYDDDYTLDISDGEKTYEVKLDIPMQTRLPDAEAETADVSKA